MSKGFLKMSTCGRIGIAECKDTNKLLEDLKQSADAAGMPEVEFIISESSNVIEMKGWKPVSFTVSNGDDEDEKKRLKAWMKLWSHMSKMGYKI